MCGLGLLIFSSGVSQEEGRSPTYPFDVSLGGQLAVVENDLFARISDPVSPAAELVAGVDPDTIFVNIFPCDDEGNLAQEDQANAKVIMVPNVNRVTLDQTMDKSVLKDGWYLMNVVLRSLGTSRVVFQVVTTSKETG